MGNPAKIAQINTFDKLAQQNTRHSINKKKKKDRVSVYSSDESDTENEDIDEKISCSPATPVMDFNVIDLQFIDKSLRFSNTNKNNILNQITKSLNNGNINSLQTHSNTACKSITECSVLKELFYH